jgi:chromosome partitioning protein
VVINTSLVKREDQEVPAVPLSRARFERLWSGQISQRTAFLGSLAASASASESHGDSACKVEIARLWSAIERSVEAAVRLTPGIYRAKRLDRDGDPQRVHYGGR